MAWAPVTDLTGPPGENALPSGFFDVTAYGATGDGSTDDTSAIQAAIAASTDGGMVWFPGGTYLVSTTIRLVPDRAYVGAGGRPGLTTIKAAAGLSGGAVVAGAGWYDNADSVGRVHVEGLFIDVSSVAGAHGLVTFSFWSTYRDIQVANVNGAAAHGLHVTDRCRNGTTVSTSSHSENIFQACRFYDHTNGATGFYQESINGFSNQDGHLEGSFFASCSGYAIQLNRAAGWTVSNNHTYGTGKDAIQLWSCYATKVIGNYIEDMGGENTSGGYYNGICLATILDTRASVVTGNTVSTNQPSSPTGAQWCCYYFRPGGGQNFANVVVSGNTAVFSATAAPTTTRSWAFRFGEGGDTGRLLGVEWSGNQVENVSWWQGTRYIASGGSVALDEPRLVMNPITAGSVSSSVTSDASAGGDFRDITVTGSAVSVGVPTNPTNRQTLEYCFYASVGTTVTFNSSIRLSTGLSTRAFAVSSGQVLYAALKYSALHSAWTLVAATSSVT